MSEGSAADVLATADTDIMDSAVSQGLVGDPQEFATNTLSIIVPEGNPAGITGFDDSLNAEGVNLVICDPESHVPCGTATKKMEETTGVTLTDPASKETKVSDVRSKVESGEADAGIVYVTDAATAKGTEEITIPDLGVVNHYPIATTSSSTNEAGGKAFVDFVLSDKGQEILQNTYKFGAPADSAAATKPAMKESTEATEPAESAESGKSN